MEKLGSLEVQEKPSRVLIRRDSKSCDILKAPPKLQFTIVVAMTETRGIGAKNSIPWRLPKDISYFTRLTKTTESLIPSQLSIFLHKQPQNAVIMGRRTYESLPDRYKPLPGRLNIVITKKISDWPPGVVALPSLKDALEYCDLQLWVNNIFVIGGEQLYREAIESPYCRNISVTIIQNQDFPCDRFFPEIDNQQFVMRNSTELIRDEKNGIDFKMEWYERVSPDELAARIVFQNLTREL